MAKRGGFPGGGMGMGMNMNNMMRQAQKMQQDMARVQEELKQREYEASAGGGVVTAKVNGEHKLLGLAIKPEAVDPDDVEMLADLVVAAVNEAMRVAGEEAEKEMGKITGGLNLPGLV